MPGKLCPHLILEGTRLTLKTETAFALNEHPAFVGPRKYRYHSPIVSAEWCGFTDQPWGRGLVSYEPEEEARAMEAYATWARLFELLPYSSWILDRFHLSTRAFQKAARGRDVDFAWLEERLLRLGFHVALLTRTPSTFDTARAERLKVSANPAQYDDLSRFVAEQELLRSLAARSRLPVAEFDISDSDVGGVADRVVAWMWESGCLYAPEAGFAGAA
ncbi:hypothetical protein FBQ97_03845 [Acidobacteria bacterium ACD]|nr:MAG: hypothetical protein EDX89_24110 [Acidobacteriota bacterium]MCE7958098.1 hypothetical protein [Acidobacteria bacterium ACB2]MDL1948931.1 hypothetical protein [Acidobacteria bacterium ACD]